jgi:3-isopropylmalate/(R)-2-methylmalate dehydratase large subunit
MKGQTIAEKILSAHAGRTVFADELVIVPVDGIMATDTTAPIAIKAFRAMTEGHVWDAQKCALIIDHAAPAPNEKIGNLHKFMRDFAAEQDIQLYDIGVGICHQVIIEEQRVKPGDIFIGADSHSCTYGALNAFSTGVGSTDLAAVMMTGKIWLKVPKSIKVVYSGSMQTGVSAKDLIMHLNRLLGIDGATYQSIEFHGDAVERMGLASRIVLANMAIEMGGKAGICTPQGLELPYEWTPTFADDDAEYSRVIEIDVTQIQPQIAFPHAPDNVKAVAEALGTPIQYAFIGSCTNGRLEDLHAAAQVLKGKQIAPSVRFLIAPASKNVFMDALRDGTVELLTAAGATFLPSGCGPCVGSHLGVPGDGETVISSTNRNFKGRMGNPNALVYLASPATVAASALRGCISLPAS